MCSCSPCPNRVFGFRWPVCFRLFYSVHPISGVGVKTKLHRLLTNRFDFVLVSQTCVLVSSDQFVSPEGSPPRRIFRDGNYEHYWCGVGTGTGYLIAGDGFRRRPSFCLSTTHTRTIRRRPPVCRPCSRACARSIQLGADPNSQSDVGRTPMWRAAYNGHLEMVQLLLQAWGGAACAVLPRAGPVGDAVHSVGQPV